jgi:hypothetical protein
VTTPTIVVGQKAPVRKVTVDKDWLNDFASLMGRPKQDHWLSCFTRFRDAEFELLNGTGFVLDQTLHGEQEYTRGPAPFPRLGELLEMETSIASHQERHNSRTGRTMHILGFQTEFKCGQGLCMTANTTFIFL